MRSVRLLAASILAGTGLVAIGATSQSANAAGSLNLNVAYTSVIKLEVITATGTLPTANARPIKLQYRNKTSDPWQTLKVSESVSDGYFYFTFTTGKTRYFRYYAPAFGGQPSIKGNSRKLTVVAQKIQFFAVSAYCDGNGHNLVTMMADFYPARPGRAVRFTTPLGERYSGQDSNGIASVVVNTGPDVIIGASSVATAVLQKGAPAFSSAPFNYQASHCSPA